MDSLVLLVALALAVAALRRTRGVSRLEARTGALEGEIAALRRELDRLAGTGAPPARPGAAPGPAAGPPPAEEIAPPRPAPPPAVAAPTGPAASSAPAGPVGADGTAEPRRRRPERPRPTWPRLEVDWERLLGVRGAAVLGGVVLALAGLYFFQYSIEHGLIPPWLRVVAGTALGLGCVLGAEWRARPRYEATANGLVGGGVVVLYAAFWAAHSLYGLVGGGMAAALMIAVTATCTALAYRHASLVIALVGLIGGFATPLLLASGEDRPIALFAYVLVLDAALLFVARRRGWSVLALVSLVATVLYQALWIGTRMDESQLAIAVAVLAVFAGAFAFALRDLPSGGRREWLWTQAGASLLPFGFGLALAFAVEPREHMVPIGLGMALLSASAAWLARAQDRAWLGLAAACASTAVFATWAWELDLGRGDLGIAWQVVGLAVVLAGVFHAFVELEPRRPGRDGPAPAAMVSALGLGALLARVAWASPETGVAPWLAGWAALTALAWRHAGFGGRAGLQAAAVVPPALGLAGLRALHARSNLFDDPSAGLALWIALAAAVQLVALRRRDAEVRRGADRAAALLAAIWLAALCTGPDWREAPHLALAASSALGALAAFAASRIPSGRALGVAVALTAAVQTLWTQAHPAPDPAAFALQLATAAAATFWPFAVFAPLRGERLAWIAAALALPLWFPSLLALWMRPWGEDAVGLLPVGLGALSLGATALAARRRPASDPRRVSDLAWFGAVAMGFVTVAIPLQLEKQWITLGWALEALAVAVLWRRLDHPGLKAFAALLAVAVTLRLVANEAVLAYHPRSAWRIVNWLLYTYWVPTAALLGAARVLARDEVARLRDFERRLYPLPQPLAAAACGLGAIAIFFVWINLAIADWFGSGEFLRVGVERMPARDLTTSLAWALYALVLLAAGVRGRRRAVRWLSLGLMLVTAGKVFLYDLGELEDLYRVGSLLGLAVSLMGISLAYQRFVVRDRGAEEA